MWKQWVFCLTCPNRRCSDGCMFSSLGWATLDVAPTDAASHPSFFEIIAQQYLVPTLEPAVEYVWAVLASHTGGREPWRTLARRADEVFCLGLAALDWYHLSHYDGTFSENFYGLARVDARRGGPLSRKRLAISLLLTTSLGYARHRLPGSVIRVYEAAAFALQVLYLYGRTTFFTPLLLLERVRLVRLSPDDLKAHEARALLSRTTLSARFPHSRLWRWATRTIFAAMDAAQFVLPVAVFVFRFIEWWHSEENEALHRARERLPPPPPPAPVPPLVELDPAHPKLCPLCGERRTNTATTPAGYCFCYPCLHRHVSEHGACPVSGVTTSVEEIVKIYEE